MLNGISVKAATSLCVYPALLLAFFNLEGKTSLYIGIYSFFSMIIAFCTIILLHFGINDALKMG